MKPVRTPETNVTLTLPGGTADNDLPAQRAMVYNSTRGERPEDAQRALISIWQPDDDEARHLEAGGCVQLTIYGDGHPVVSVGVTEAVVPERELIDRGHVDRAIGHLYGQLAQQRDDLDEFPDAARFVELWAEAVSATRPAEAGGPGDPPAPAPRDASQLEDPDPILAPPHEECRAPDRVCAHRAFCLTSQACTYGPDTGLGSAHPHGAPS